jgi:hypothetical protein
MRAKASQLVLATALVLAVPCGFASQAKPAAASRSPAKTKPTSHQAKAVAAAHVAGKVTKPVAEARVQLHKALGKPVVQREKQTPIVHRAEPVAAPQPAPEDDSIHVTHDRKQHFSPQLVGATGQPRKATSADFLSNAPAAGAAQPVKRKPAPVESKPAAPEVPPTTAQVLYNKRGRLIVPPALKGSHEILLHQNEMADQEGLDRVQDDAGLDQMREDKLLVAIPAGPGLQTDERLPANRRYCRPWTAQFLTALSHAFYAKFHTALQVNSAVRTVEFQQRLLLTNGNAAPAEGETASPHLTGQAVDLAKHGLSLADIAWLRGYLLPLVQAGKVDVEEEFQQACFHISVYRKYIPQPAPKREIAATHHAVGATLATAIR